MRRSGLPLTALLALVVPVLAGLTWMAVSGAAVIYLLINGAALALAILAALWLPMPRSDNAAMALALSLLALLAATQVFGPEVSGVQRWIALGPLRLHAGYLLLPLLVVLAARLPVSKASALLLPGIVICLVQPDPATVVALAAAITAQTLFRRDLLAIAMAVAACAAAIWSLSQPELLTPVRFVEDVQSAAFAANAVAGIALTVAGFLPALLLAQPDPGYRSLALFMVAAAGAAFVNPYPAILIGYGASPILGLGLALAALREPGAKALNP